MPFDHPWLALADAAQRWPDHPAYIFPHQNARLTFAQVHARAASIAAGLKRLGLRAGDHVALLAENRIEWPLVQMACAALAAVFVPLNTHYRKDDLGYALKQSRAKALILSDSYRGNPYRENVEALRSALPDLQHVISLDDEAWQNFCAGQAFDAALYDPDHPGALLYTSGTTGFPKGALLSHRAMMMDARGSAERLGLRSGDRWTSIIPLFHCAGCILNILGSLQFGAAYVGIPSFDAEQLFKNIEAERCTFLSGVPTSYLAMLDHPARAKHDLSSLRAGTCGGADCNPEILGRCAAEFPMPGLCQVYGQTEGGTLFTCPGFDDPARWETAGIALPGYELRIADPQTEAILANGQIGEIQARGPMTMIGYYDMPQATAETFTADGWLRTGDLGYVRDDDHLVIAGGRLRDMIIRGGENIYPAEIENTLQQHPAISAVAVFAVADTYYGEVVAAAVQLAQRATAKDLQRFCAERIAKFKMPSVVYQVDSFPLTPSGKVRKVELRRLAAEGQLAKLP